MREILYLEDLRPGLKFKTGAHPLTEDEIKVFAREYDPQPFHIDPQAARHSFFGGLAASGWHTAAISMRLQVDSGPALAGGMIGASVELSWPPSRSKPDRGFITLKSETKNQKDEVLQLQTSKLLVWRRKPL
jgi:acyl dehydratase